MKKALIFIIVSLSCGLAFSQNGEILYRDFDPDICVDYYPTVNGPMPDVFIDINQDGTDDFLFHAENEWGHMISLVLKRKDDNAQNDWKFRIPYLLYDENNYLPILGDTVFVGDTIANIEESWYPSYKFYYNIMGHPEGQVPHISPNDHCFISVRKAVEEGYCYGWIDAIIYIPPENQVDDYHIYLTICRMAYCTIPNYPLCVGQTDFAWDVDENDSRPNATIHPNPTTGLVSVLGKNLRLVEVFNTIGQRILTVNGEGETLSLDLGSQPAGIYFVNITDSEGRKCVKKVVKE